jgi:hypothetical protein
MVASECNFVLNNKNKIHEENLLTDVIRYSI